MHPRGSLSQRKRAFDLYCESLNGEKFIVEIQKEKHNLFRNRLAFYESFPLYNECPAEKPKVSSVYLVGLLGFSFKDKEEGYLHREKLSNDTLTVLSLELPKFNKTVDEIGIHLDKWLYAIKGLISFQERPSKLEGKIFERLFEAASIARLTSDQREEYEYSLKIYRDLKNVIDTAWEEGYQRGLTKARANRPVL